MRKGIIFLLIMGACIIFFYSAIIATEDESKISYSNSEDIIKLLKLSGSGKLGGHVIRQLVGTYKKMMPGVPGEYWDKFISEVNPDELAELCAPVYEKYLSHEEIKALVKFYEGPVGRKILKVQPQILQECMAIESEWGEKLGVKIVKRLKEQGYFKKF